MIVVRLRFSVPVLAGVLALSSCATFSNDSARVGDRALSDSELDALIVGYASSGGDTDVTGPQDAALARNLLTTWITTEVTLDLVAREGGSVNDADLAAATEKLDAASGFADAAESVRALFIRNEAARTVLGSLMAPPDDELRSLYESGPSDSGVVCVRAILTDSKEEIDTATLRLLGGESFADVAAEVSIDPSKAEGGALTGEGGSACIDYASVVEGVAPQFVDALEATRVDTISTAFEIPGTGWAIVLPRPFDEVADDVRALIGGQAAASATSAALASADVWVSARVGRWNPATAVVEKLG